jgi:hypothetical protein
MPLIMDPYVEHCTAIAGPTINLVKHQGAA